MINFYFQSYNKNNVMSISKDETFFTIKCPLNKIILDPNLISKIEDAVIRTNKIVIHTCQFIKLYLIYLLGINESFPLIDNYFILTSMTIISKCKIKATKTTPETKILKEKLTDFYNNHYKSLNSEIIAADSLKQILRYEADKIITNIENLIKSQYVKRVCQYINQQMNLKKIEIEIKKSKSLDDNMKKRHISEIRSDARKVKTDVFNVENNILLSSVKYHWIIKDIRSTLLPKKLEYAENSIFNDLKVNPMNYLPQLMRLNFNFEQDGIKLFHAFPLRSDVKPKYITLDTTSIIQLLLEPRIKYKVDELEPVTKSNMLVTKHKRIWFHFFNEANKCFHKKNYNFHYMIKTDGTGVSVLFDKPNTKVKSKNNYFNQEQAQQKEFCYLQEIKLTPNLQKKNIVGIDPGKSDIIYCADQHNNYFRYTANQRRFEIGTKKHSKIMEGIKKFTKIDDHTVKEYEAALSKYNSKTCDPAKFQEYISIKTQVNAKLFEFYKNSQVRQFKFNQYVNTQRSESNMVNHFKEKYGGPKNTIIALGDHTQGQHQMKYHEPTKDIGMRRVFQKHGYRVYLINEAYTSKLCHGCKSENEKFYWRPSMRPKTKGQIRQVHGLIRCTNVQCRIKWNRDVNASLNILEIATSILAGKGKPKAFQGGDLVNEPSKDYR